MFIAEDPEGGWKKKLKWSVKVSTTTYLGQHTFIILDYCLIELYYCTEMPATTTGD